MGLEASLSEGSFEKLGKMFREKEESFVRSKFSVYDIRGQVAVYVLWIQIRPWWHVDQVGNTTWFSIMFSSFNDDTIQ